MSTGDRLVRRESVKPSCRSLLLQQQQGLSQQGPGRSSADQYRPPPVRPPSGVRLYTRGWIDAKAAVQAPGDLLTGRVVTGSAGLGRPQTNGPMACGGAISRGPALVGSVKQFTQRATLVLPPDGGGRPLGEGGCLTCPTRPGHEPAPGGETETLRNGQLTSMDGFALRILVLSRSKLF